VGFLYKILEMFKSIFNSLALIIIIFIGLATLLIDGPRFKNKGFTKELRIVKTISYTYIALGIIIFIFFRII
jgi:hypothetical protein